MGEDQVTATSPFGVDRVGFVPAASCQILRDGKCLLCLLLVVIIGRVRLDEFNCCASAAACSCVFFCRKNAKCCRLCFVHIFCCRKNRANDLLATAGNSQQLAKQAGEMPRCCERCFQTSVGIPFDLALTGVGQVSIASTSASSNSPIRPCLIRQLRSAAPPCRVFSRLKVVRGKID